MHPTLIESLATALFACALIHTFLVKQVQEFACRYPDGSFGENFFHLMGEVEVVFGFWAGIFIMAQTVIFSRLEAVRYLDGLNFTEPVFVFAIMAIAASRPILVAADRLLRLPTHLVQARLRPLAFYLSALVIGPLLGSLITEPAAMTVTALSLKSQFYDRGMSKRFMYSTLGVLFVNVSIGGTLTHFAAPPVLMVAGPWGWDTTFMMTHFGWKAVIAVLLNGAFCLTVNFKELKSVFADGKNKLQTKRRMPLWVVAVHIGFLSLVVLNSHHMVVFMLGFLFFLGFVNVSAEYNDTLKLREALLVAFFLGGLVVLGKHQSWWIMPVITGLESKFLFYGAAALTAVTDNAALTYLGAQVPQLSESSRYALVAGAVAGGGLTVIANAPNPAGYSILNPCFGENGINPVHLLLGAALPTLTALLCLSL